MNTLNDAIVWVNGYLWGPPMLRLLLGTHLYLTIRLKFVQRYIWMAIKLSFSKDKSGVGDVSHFAALSTALAATIGTGNIVGVATALSVGGPGALFWMWLTGVFGIATKYSEALLAVKYRVRTSDGTMLGGPMYALQRGLGQKWLAVLFCIFTSLAAFGIGNMVQANSVSSIAKETFGIAPWITGIVLMTLTGVVILGGLKWIACACEGLVPFMAFFYVVGCLIILFINAEHIWPAMKLIFSHAFTPSAAGGGFVGASVMTAARWGIARGLFSNESGLGSAPIVAAAARTRNPVRQALVSSTGTFWDTVVVCALTGLVLVSATIGHKELSGLQGIALTKGAFELIPPVGPIVLTVGLLTFVYSTILGWSYYGERAMEYLFGKKSIAPYRIVWVLAVFAGSVANVPLVWNFADAMNALMAIPNVISLLLLTNILLSETRKYLWDKHMDEESETA